MKLKVVVHEAGEEGGWAEAPSIPGCATQGETFEELLKPGLLNHLLKMAGLHEDDL
ncbi:MAG: type II toxin-antitoxin system HicB family antitoxin [Syntrophobacteraceae bacterium]|nr:type II toxin-antitoxin system HicB family antitoxin [Syntrophobacteraceae bacterium]